MNPFRNRLRGRAALLGLLATTTLAACGEDTPDILPATTSPVSPLFESYVALGNSITAGYQSGGINDSTQRESYARLVAASMNTRYAYPRLAGRGCAPPVINIDTRARFGPGSTAGTCDFRDPESATAELNNVGVPGAATIDLMSTSGNSANTLTQLFLGGLTQVERALVAKPTFVSLWIGNNDILTSALSGVPFSSPTTPTFTSQANFQTRYAAGVNRLVQGAPGLEGILIGVVDPSNAAVLIPATSLTDAGANGTALRAAINRTTGKTVTIHPNCATTGATSRISLVILDSIRTGGHPALIACEPFTGSGAVGQAFVLQAAELGAVQQAVAGYNTYIAAKADSLGWAYLDPNPTLQQLRSAGNFDFPPLTATQPYGPLISLDGVHPAGAAHVLVANLVIDAINDHYDTNLPAVTAETRARRLVAMR